LLELEGVLTGVKEPGKSGEIVVEALIFDIFSLMSDSLPDFVVIEASGSIKDSELPGFH